MPREARRRVRPRQTRKMWGGVFRMPTAPIVESFTTSLPVDRRLYPYDVAGSIAHCRGLVRARLLTGREGSRLIAGLRAVKQELDRGSFQFDPGDEDIHSAVERRLGERLGRLAQMLHTGRSRNDQVVLDVRLYLRDEIDVLTDHLVGLQRILRLLATRLFGHVLPGYTHLQRAQPVLISHHLLAYHDMVGRDAERFSDCRRRVDVLPLGAGALAGSGFPIDRQWIARQLGFGKVSTNSIDAVADRDFIAEFLAAAALLAMHLSRLAEEIVLWASAEFGFVTLPDAFATGSSMMPQKRNPDVAELLRGKSGRVYGDLMTILTLLKGLPLAYNRDLQEDKAPLFDAADTLNTALEITTAMLPQLVWNTAAMRAAAGDENLVATDLADALVERGLSFRQAHEVVGRLVASCRERRRSLSELSAAELRRASPLLDQALVRGLTPEASVRRRLVLGGTAPTEVRRRLRELDRLHRQNTRRHRAARARARPLPAPAGPRPRS
jgi:argininosuccinate lyase